MRHRSLTARREAAMLSGLQDIELVALEQQQALYSKNDLCSEFMTFNM